MRKYVRDKKDEQIEVSIIGESKAPLSKNKIEAFLHKKLWRLEGVFSGELFPIIVTYLISQPDVKEFALKQGIKQVYYSYEFSS